MNRERVSQRRFYKHPHNSRFTLLHPCIDQDAGGHGHVERLCRRALRSARNDDTLGEKRLHTRSKAMGFAAEYKDRRPTRPPGLYRCAVKVGPITGKAVPVEVGELHGQVGGLRQMHVP